MSTSDPEYILGYSEAEFRRLEQQSEFYADLTEDVLRRGGLEPGMHVLDVGCGAGDVSLLAAGLVGAGGSVLGVDQAGEAVAVATARAAARGATNVSFERAAIDEATFDRTFDAVIGRFVLLYCADPVATLRRVAAWVRPGGVIAFHEMDMTTIRAVPCSPLWDAAIGWVVDTFRRSPFREDMGAILHATFREAGLLTAGMIAGSRVEAGADSPAYSYVTETVRSLLPMAQKAGVTDPAEVGIDTLAERLCDELATTGGVVYLPLLTGAWARIR